MPGSLQDQLLQSGLADGKKAKKLAKQKRKETNVARHEGVDLVDESKEAARQAHLEKVERDKALNRNLHEKAQNKAINAQIRQLIEANKLAKGRGELGFKFADGKKVKNVYVNALEHKQLSAGILAIVKQGDQYEIVPRPVAEKIAERDQGRVIRLEETADVSLTEEEQDWYKDYEIPEDLMW